MNDLQIFKNPEFGSVRVIEINGEPWLIGKDVATILGYNNTRDALAKHVDEEDKGVAKCDTLGGAQDLTIINESGLYRLILSSRMPKAKEFKRWVTSEVLPAIRKTGAYAAPGTITNALSEMHAAMKQMRALLQEMQQIVPRRSGVERALQARDRYLTHCGEY